MVVDFDRACDTGTPLHVLFPDRYSHAGELLPDVGLPPAIMTAITAPLDVTQPAFTPSANHIQSNVAKANWAAEDDWADFLFETSLTDVAASPDGTPLPSRSPSPGPSRLLPGQPSRSQDSASVRSGILPDVTPDPSDLEPAEVSRPAFAITLRPAGRRQTRPCDVSCTRVCEHPGRPESPNA
eukprot:2206252-Rhodomonas_salina.2